MDVFSKDKRSEIMSHIKSKNSKPEMLVRSFLHRNGLRFRLHVKELPGAPDIVLPKYKTLVFIHGCFWHGHNNPKCKARLPKSRLEYWSKKINGNRERDIIVQRNLQTDGWHVIIVWECELSNNKELRLKALIDEILSNYQI